MASSNDDSAVTSAKEDTAPTPEKEVKKPEEWKDITTLLDQAAKEMKLGQLIHVPNFQLIEAMSAIELMDPKMDTGMNASKIHTLAERLQLNTLPLDSTLTLPQLLKLFDYLLCNEVMYYDGQQLVQTVMSCIYLHDVKVISNPLLLAFAVATIKTCDLHKNVIIRADTYQEEDFIAVTYGFNMCEKLPDTEMAKLLKDAEDKLALQLKKAKGATGPDVDGVAPLQDDKTLEVQLCEAFIARIRLRKALYMVQAYFDKRNVEGVKKTVVYGLQQLSIIESTAALGQDFPETIREPNIARRMPIPTPNRPLFTVTVPAMAKYLERLFKDADKITAIYNDDNLWNLRLFLEDFSRSNASIISRSRLRLFVSNDNKILYGKNPVSSLAVQSMTSLKVPQHMIQAEQTKTFLDRCAQVLMSTVHIMCLNRARQRRSLPRLFDDMSILQMEADQLDDQFTPPEQTENSGHYLGRWVMDLSISLMTHYLELGFELDLYSSHEYAFVYWYLDYLYGLQHQNQHLIVEHAAKEKLQAKLSKKGKAKQTKKKEKEVLPALVQSIPQLHAEARQHTCRGVFRYICALQLAGKVVPPTFQFGSPEIRFGHRFEAFLKLHQPTPLSYNHYEQTTNFGQYKPQQLMEAAQDSFKTAKGFLEKIVHHKTPSPDYYIAEVRALAKLSISNTLQLQQLLGSKLDTLASTPTYDFMVFRSFPVISLPKAK